MYHAKFDFEGQAGEMSLKKDDTVELVEKDDNGLYSSGDCIHPAAQCRHPYRLVAG